MIKIDLSIISVNHSFSCIFKLFSNIILGGGGFRGYSPDAKRMKTDISTFCTGRSKNCARSSQYWLNLCRNFFFFSIGLENRPPSTPVADYRYGLTESVQIMLIPSAVVVLHNRRAVLGLYVGRFVNRNDNNVQLNYRVAIFFFFLKSPYFPNGETRRVTVMPEFVHNGTELFFFLLLNYNN